MFGLLVACLVLSGFCAPLSSGNNPINCASIVKNDDYTSAQADCTRIDYCYWDTEDGEGACKKDDCLEALNDYDDDDCTISGCNKYRYNTTPTCEDNSPYATRDRTSKGYCTRKVKADDTALPCHYEFVKSGTCSGDDCELVPYNRTAGGVGQQIQSPICVSKPGPCEKLGTQSCHTDSNCVVLGDQCVTDICAGLLTYDPVTKTDNQCTQESPINWRIICKEYEIYTSTGRGGSGDGKYTIKKETKCGSKFGKYYGNYNTPDPCAQLTTKFLWMITDDKSDEHGCVAPDLSKCVNPVCDTEDAPLNCTSATGIAGVTCQVVEGKCTDGRETVYTPPEPEKPEECGGASVFRSPSVLVMLVLAVFVTIFHTF